MKEVCNEQIAKERKERKKEGKKERMGEKKTTNFCWGKFQSTSLFAETSIFSTSSLFFKCQLSCLEDNRTSGRTSRFLYHLFYTYNVVVSRIAKCTTYFCHVNLTYELCIMTHMVQSRCVELKENNNSIHFKTYLNSNLNSRGRYTWLGNSFFTQRFVTKREDNDLSP